MQPAPLSGVHRNRIFRPTQHFIKWQIGPLAPQIPQRDINRRQCQRRNRAHRRGMNRKQQITPDTTNFFCVLADQLINQIVAQKGHHRTATLSDRIAIPKPRDPVTVGDLDKGRLLAVKRLDRISAPNHGRQINHKNINR